MSEPISKKMQSIINGRSVICGLVLMIPFPLLDEIVYGILLWTMYGKIADAAGVPFREHFVKNVVGGFIVNIISVIIIDSICDALSAIGIGFVLAFIAGVAGTQISGKMYVNQLKLFHGKKVAEHPNVRVEGAQTTGQQQINPNNGVQYNAIPPMYNSQTIPPLYNRQVSPPVYNQQVAQQVYSQPQSQNSNLLTCPDCGQMVSRRADACPNCGCPISEMN